MKGKLPAFLLRTVAVVAIGFCVFVFLVRPFAAAVEGHLSVDAERESELRESGRFELVTEEEIDFVERRVVRDRVTGTVWLEVEERGTVAVVVLERPGGGEGREVER